ARVENCYVLDNSASKWGGGIFAEGDGLVYNTLLSGNTAGEEGLAIYGTTLDVRNVTVSENRHLDDLVTVDESYCNKSTPAWIILGTQSFATDSVWLTDTLLWSDAVSMNTCQKTAYDGGRFEPPVFFHADCRSNPDYKGDFFSWCAVKKFGDLLCPHPWRVPTTEEFVSLDLILGGTGDNRTDLEFVNTNYLGTWGGAYNGNCQEDGTLYHHGSIPHGTYWSQSQILVGDLVGLELGFSSLGNIYPQWALLKSYGSSLRCVQTCPRIMVDIAAETTRHQAVCQNTPIATVTHSWSGAAADATLTWESSVPAGITGDASSFSGTPTTAGVYKWTMTTKSSYATCPARIDTGSVTVYELPATVVISGETPACDSTILTASNGNDGIIFWQDTVSNGTSTAMPDTMQTVTVSGTYYFRAYSDQGCWGEQGSRTVTINTIPTILTHPNTTDQTIAEGGVFPPLSVSVSISTSLTYQWYSNTQPDTIGGTLMVGETAPNLTPPNTIPLDEKRYYYCIIGNSCGSVVSNISGAHAVIFVDSNGCNTLTPGWGESLGTVTFATTQQWVVGNQVWSDAVQTTNCDSRTSYNGGSVGNFNSDCRSNPGYTGDLFSWCAVVRFQDSLCPHPWRVPTLQDFIDLDLAMGGSGNERWDAADQLIWYVGDQWGGTYSGACWDNGIFLGNGILGHYWSQTASNIAMAYYLDLHSTADPQANGIINPGCFDSKFFGYSLRCVRDTTPPENSNLILDVSLLNLTDGLVDRSIYQRPNRGGTSGVSVYSEGGLRLSQSGGAVPKWDFNRPIASVTYEFEAKLFSMPYGHGETICFVRNPEDIHPIGTFLTGGGQNQIIPLWKFTSTYVQPTIPLNVWRKIRVEIGDPIAGKIEVKMYIDDVLKSSEQCDYSTEVFPYITLTPNYGYDYHDRADAAIRNLKVWVRE
ncbi:MAG: hypothetical protein FWG79_09880, partial [Bacteroidales bacterium]|nr:hypothetical protein [Bacteroidales bacterium]